MKTIRMFGCLMVAVCLCFGMTSCSEDDEESAGVSKGNSAAKLGNHSFSVPYGFWYVDTYSTNTSPDGMKRVWIEFTSIDATSGEMSASTVHWLGFGFDIPVDANQIPNTVVTNSKYDAFVNYGMTSSSPGIQCESNDSDTNKPNLIIERSGDNYTIKVENLKVGDGTNDYNFSFNYSGKLKNERIGS